MSERVAVLVLCAVNAVLSRVNDVLLRLTDGPDIIRSGPCIPPGDEELLEAEGNPPHCERCGREATPTMRIWDARYCPECMNTIYRERGKWPEQSEWQRTQEGS